MEVRFQESQKKAYAKALPTGSPVFTDVIIAVHGIGQQSRFSTIRSVATRLAGSRTLLTGFRGSLVAPQPLGYFHSEVRSVTSIRTIDDEAGLEKEYLAKVGFAEVFWADIPEEVVKEGRTLEETKAWARTVVARANVLCERAKAKGTLKSIPPDFGLAGEVLDEIIETVYVLENLSFIADKAGILKFQLRQVLEDYLGDVQLVAEFKYYRADIIGRFHQAMESIYNQCQQSDKPVRLHIVAHSEGTVVSFLGMLQAMSNKRFVPADASGKSDASITDLDEIPEWLKHVQGYMTIGSPIDKHILLWPRLFEQLEPCMANKSLLRGQIHWRNYYDYGDPVGFKLDSARLWLKEKGCHAFQFCGCQKCRHDIGFARYFLAGEAHNEYWKDSEVFDHFVREVVKPEEKRPEIPKDRPLIAIVSPALPYLLSFILLLIGVFILHKAMVRFTHPAYDSLEKYVRFMLLGVQPALEGSGFDPLYDVLGIGLLVAGSTLLARFPRLATGIIWKIAGLIAFLIGSVAYIYITTLPCRNAIGAIFGGLGTNAPTAGMIAIAAIIGVLGFLVTSKRVGNKDRRQRWFWRGTRPLIFCGALGITFTILWQLYPNQFGTDLRLTREEQSALSPKQIEIVKKARFTHEQLGQIIAGGPKAINALEKVEPVLIGHPPAWPLVLAGLAFLYLWWLAILIFDLAFVWHRYIRRSRTNDRLREWQGIVKGSVIGPESCSNPDPNWQAVPN